MTHPPSNPSSLPSQAKRAPGLVAVITALSLGAGPRLAQASHAAPAPDKASEELPDVTEVPDAAPPDTPPDAATLSKAMEAYQKGTKNFNNGAFEAALADFQVAASLYASPDFQYNIARCYEELGKHEEAIRGYETYLKAKPDAEDKVGVENRIKLLRKILEEERKRKAEEAKPTVIYQSTGKDPAARRAELARPLIVSGAVVGGIGVALGAGGGIAFGIVAGNRSDSLDEIQTGGNPENKTFGEASDLADEGQRFETLQIVSAASGAGLVVVGGVLVVLGVVFRKKGKGSPPSPAKASLVPTLSRRHAGLALVGRF